MGARLSPRRYGKKHQDRAGIHRMTNHPYGSEDHSMVMIGLNSHIIPIHSDRSGLREAQYSVGPLGTKTEIPGKMLGRKIPNVRQEAI